MKRIGVIYYGAGNIGSIMNMLRRLGAVAVIVDRPNLFNGIDKFILPGVGSFDYGMRMLNDKGLSDSIKEVVNIHNRQLLGICLGAQMMTKSSEEGNVDGLGLFDADVRHFSNMCVDKVLRIPHVGWENIELTRNSFLFENFLSVPKFYFSHSYYIDSKCDNDVVCKAYYGSNFVAALSNGNIHAVQFHPEKSHKFGMQLITNFINR